MRQQLKLSHIDQLLSLLSKWETLWHKDQGLIGLTAEEAHDGCLRFIASRVENFVLVRGIAMHIAPFAVAHGIDPVPLLRLAEAQDVADLAGARVVVQAVRAALAAEPDGKQMPETGKPLSKEAKALAARTSLPDRAQEAEQTDIRTDPATAKLKDRHVNALEAMIALTATDRDGRKTAQQIAAKADGAQADAESYKRPLADLVQWGYANSEQGRSGGAWISKAGKAALKEHKRASK